MSNISTMHCNSIYIYLQSYTCLCYLLHQQSPCWGSGKLSKLWTWQLRRRAFSSEVGYHSYSYIIAQDCGIFRKLYLQNYVTNYWVRVPSGPVCCKERSQPPTVQPPRCCLSLQILQKKVSNKCYEDFVLILQWICGNKRGLYSGFVWFKHKFSCTFDFKE